MSADLAGRCAPDCMNHTEAVNIVFYVLDWSIVGLYILGFVAVGVSTRRYIGEVGQFLVAAKQLDAYLGIA